MHEKPVRRTRSAKDSGTYRGLRQRFWPLVQKKEKKGNESITSHPMRDQPRKQRRVMRVLPLTQPTKKNHAKQVKGIALILLEGEMRINHSHEGDLRITAHLHLKLRTNR